MKEIAESSGDNSRLDGSSGITLTKVVVNHVGVSDGCVTGCGVWVQGHYCVYSATMLELRDISYAKADFELAEIHALKLDGIGRDGQ